MTAGFDSLPKALTAVWSVKGIVAGKGEKWQKPSYIW